MERTERKCLKCLQPFVIPNRFRFLCDKCNHENSLARRCRAEGRGHGVIVYTVLGRTLRGESGMAGGG